jgi:hypothetical protein
MRVTVRAVARDQCTHRRMGGLVRAHRCARVAARAAPRVRDGGAGLGVRALRPARWSAIETLNATHLRRLAYLRAEYVVGTRPVTLGGRRLNQGYLWSVVDGVQPLRCKVAIKVINVTGERPAPCLLAQLSGRFASPRNLWCVQERPAAAPPYEGLRRL